MTLLINKQKKRNISRTRKYAKGYGFLSFARNLSGKCRKQLLDTELNSLKVVSKKVVHKTEFLGNKIADAVAKLNNDKIVKQKPVIYENARTVEEMIIPPEKREEMLNDS